MELEDRIESVEKSVKTIAEYVKKEVSDFKSTPHATDTKDLEKTIENYVDRKVAETKFVPSVDEDALKRFVQDHVRKEIKKIEPQDNYEDIENFKRDVEHELTNLMTTITPKINFLESKISDLKSVKHDRKLENKIDEIEDRISDVIGVHEKLKVMEKELDNMRINVAPKMNALEASISSIKSDYEKLKSLSKKAPDIDVNAIHDFIKRTSEFDDRTETRFREFEKKLSELRSNVADIGEKSAKPVIDPSTLSDFIKKTSEFDEKVESRIREFDRKISNLRSGLTSIPAQTESQTKELERLYKKRMEQFEQEINSLSSKLLNFASSTTMNKFERGLEEKLNSFDQGVDEKISHIDAKLRKVYQDVENRKEVIHFEENKEVQDLREDFIKLKDLVDGINSAIAKSINTDKQLQALEEKVYAKIKGLEHSKQPEIGREFTDEMTDLRHFVEELHAQSISTNKYVKELEGKISSLMSLTEKGKVDIDYGRVVDHIKSDKLLENAINKAVEENSMKIVTSKLNEFSHVLDKRMPNLVTKDDLAKVESTIESRFDRARVPIKSGSDDLNRRVTELEASITNFIRMLNSMKSASYGPFVIE